MEKFFVLLEYIWKTNKIELIKIMLPWLDKWGVMAVWIVYSTIVIIFLYYTISVNCAELIHKKGWDSAMKKKIKKISHKTVSEIGYLGIFLLVLVPLPFFRIAGMNAGELFGFKYTLRVAIIANIIRIFFSTTGIFALLS